MLCRAESRLFWTMKPKSMDKPWLHVVARIVVDCPDGALRSFEARQIGQSSICVGIWNCGIPLTKRCISDRRRKLMWPSRWCHSIRKADRLSALTTHRSEAFVAGSKESESGENSGKCALSSNMVGLFAMVSRVSSNEVKLAGGTWLGWHAGAHAGGTFVVVASHPFE